MIHRHMPFTVTMRGLINRGTNCSIISVVQCLYETRELRDLIRRVEARDYGGTTNGGANNAVAPTLIREMSAYGPWPCDPTRLMNSISAYGGVSFEVQEDADMVFKCIINALADRRGLQEYVVKRGNSDKATCKCHCETCHVRTRIEITSDVLSLPPIVCVRIARVRNLGGEAACLAKMEKHFAFPETLGLKHLVKEPEDAALYYELYAVVAHRGTHHCGHYVAYTRADNGWYFTDDAYVSLCSWEDVKMTYGSDSNDNQGVAYVLMYCRIRKDK
uniref:USP domain-containing protein n=1 Tax=Monopterus albus TaxID=43700 RepID=A0A3Q3JKU7_MONAL